MEARQRCRTVTPENPTVDDVIALVKGACGNTSRLMGDWNLGCSVLINGKDAGLDDW